MCLKRTIVKDVQKLGHAVGDVLTYFVVKRSNNHDDSGNKKFYSHRDDIDNEDPCATFNEKLKNATAIQTLTTETKHLPLNVVLYSVNIKNGSGTGSNARHKMFLKYCRLQEKRRRLIWQEDLIAILVSVERVRMWPQISNCAWRFLAAMQPICWFRRCTTPTLAASTRRLLAKI